KKRKKTSKPPNLPSKKRKKNVAKQHNLNPKVANVELYHRNRHLM
ncbi:IgA-specific serine endopeptidase autotransporter precursor, partial [Haemophilus influenzae]